MRVQLLPMLAVLALGLAGCSGSDSGSAAEVSVTTDNGPVFVRPADVNPNSTIPLAQAIGTLRITDDCAYLDSPDGETSSIIIWPNSTKWISDEGIVAWSGGRSANGVEIDAAASFGSVINLSEESLPGITTYAARCVVAGVAEVVSLYQ